MQCAGLNHNFSLGTLHIFTELFHKKRPSNTRIFRFSQGTMHKMIVIHQSWFPTFLNQFWIRSKDRLQVDCILNTHKIRSFWVGVVTQKHTKPRSTQRVQTSLAEADHYAHIAHCKNVDGERLPPPPPPPPQKKRIITCTMIWVCHHYYGFFFCSFTHLKRPRSPPKFNQFVIVLLRTPP